MVGHRSPSQVKEYSECGYRYYLNRELKVWSIPGAWLVQGNAVHEGVEAWEKSGRTMPIEEVLAVYTAAYDKHVNRLCQDTPNFSYWFNSGPYRGRNDVERRFDKGKEQIHGYIHYYTVTKPEEEMWRTPDGELAVELAGDVDLDGVRVKGFIDGVITSPDHPTPFPRDLKTGQLPGGDFQLATYAVFLLVKYGIALSIGDYWMAAKGGPTKPYGLSQWTLEEVTRVYHEVDEGIRAERFDPSPSEKNCARCPVKDACSFSAA